MWLLVETVSQISIKGLISSFLTNGTLNFAFYFTFQNLTTEILVYIGLSFAIYQRHYYGWIAIEKLPVEKIYSE
jgi:hypothetical protein